jgi:hypothetical protein
VSIGQLRGFVPGSKYQNWLGHVWSTVVKKFLAIHAELRWFDSCRLRKLFRTIQGKTQPETPKLPIFTNRLADFFASGVW